jgi:hypothetical protein
MSESGTRKTGGDDSYYLVVHAYLFVVFLMTSGVVDLAPHFVVTLTKGVTLACIGCATFYCYVNRWYVPVCISIFSLLYGIFLQLIFVNVAGLSINLNAGYPIYAFGGVAVMYTALRYDPNRLVRILFRYAVCYVVLLFLFGQVPFLKNFLASTPLIGRGHGDSVSRMQILFLYPVMIAGVGFDGILRGKMNGAMLLLSLMSVVCIIFSDFRVGTSIALVVLVSYMVMKLLSFNFKMMARLYVIGTVLLLALLSVCYILDLNPYLLIYHDISALARAYGFYIIRGVMQRSPIIGMGIAPDAKTFNWAGNSDNMKFYDGDYGVFGIFVWGGLLALSLYLAVIFLSYRFADDARRIGIDNRYIGGFAQVSWFQMAYSISAPICMVGGHREYACLMVAAALLACEKKRQQAGKRKPIQSASISTVCKS